MLARPGRLGTGTRALLRPKSGAVGPPSAIERRGARSQGGRPARVRSWRSLASASRRNGATTELVYPSACGCDRTPENNKIIIDPTQQRPTPRPPLPLPLPGRVACSSSSSPAGFSIPTHIRICP
uniref:Uncharacterized protein n=1 Tax=Oryza sativa subsp. japonica TaxID=39947 RepID=Q6YYD3_ORYSJ|nr:hypothetical protein [Oryza sativa Japonica Group]BAD16295.1 hypothetical protein [Oryza sativa Japonica Group]